MDKELRLLLLKFVNREAPLGELRALISEKIWDADPAVDDSLDQVAISLVHLDDGIVDEAEFRRLMVKRLGLFQYFEPGILLTSHAFATAATNPAPQSGVYVVVTPGESTYVGSSEAITSPASIAGRY